MVVVELCQFAPETPFTHHVSSLAPKEYQTIPLQEGGHDGPPINCPLSSIAHPLSGQPKTHQEVKSVHTDEDNHLSCTGYVKHLGNMLTGVFDAFGAFIQELYDCPPQVCPPRVIAHQGGQTFGRYCAYVSI